MKEMTKKFFSRKKSKSNLKKKMVKPDSNKPLPHKERDVNTGHSTISSWDSKPKAKEAEYVNSMSGSVRERSIKLIEAVNLEGMTDAEIILALLDLQKAICKELGDVCSVINFKMHVNSQTFSI